jgi:glycosyltransferase involved in cell wall biosynthesis
MKKLAIVIPAYNAEKTIGQVFERIPPAIRSQVVRYVVVNDGSTDNTANVLARLQQDWPNVVVLQHEVNKGYGAAEKTLLHYALRTEAEVVVLLHADGQYAPEEMPRLIEAFVTEGADIVQGSRMMQGRTALRGGMPIYKYLANRALTEIQNVAFGMRMAEFHSGYMLYSRRALATIPFDQLVNHFCFDQEMLIMAKVQGLKIVQVPIPTHYGEEESHLQPIRYGFNVLGIVWAYTRGYYHRLAASTKAA